MSGARSSGELRAWSAGRPRHNETGPRLTRKGTWATVSLGRTSSWREGQNDVPASWRTNCVRPVAPPFRTTHRLNIQQVVTRSKGALVSIGNSPESPEDDRNFPADDRDSIGRALQQARIAAGLTVDEVSASTRVRIPIVHAIEEDDFTRCGGDVYARGHIRTLARAVGLDPAALIEQYDADHGGRPAPTPAAPLFEAERIRPEPRRPNWTAAMVAAIVAVVGFVGFTMFNGNDTTNTGGAVAEGPAPTRRPLPPRSRPRPRSRSPPAAPSRRSRRTRSRSSSPRSTTRAGSRPRRATASCSSTGSSSRASPRPSRTTSAST